MKKMLLFLAITLFFSANLLAQSTFPATNEEGSTPKKTFRSKSKSNTSDSLTMKAAQLGINQEDLIPSEKDPALAFLYGLICPGLGQIYNEKVTTGTIVFLGTGIVYGISLKEGEKRKKNDIIYVAPLVQLIAAIIAPFTSQSINREVRLKRAIKERMNKTESTSMLDDIQIQPYYDGKTAGLNLSYSW